jgi:hypothetical protein
VQSPRDAQFPFQFIRDSLTRATNYEHPVACSVHIDPPSVRPNVDTEPYFRAVTSFYHHSSPNPFATNVPVDRVYNYQKRGNAAGLYVTVGMRNTNGVAFPNPSRCVSARLYSLPGYLSILHIRRYIMSPADR